MRTSAVVMGVGYLLIAAQVAFSGAYPILVTLGFLLLASGLTLGLIFGNSRFRFGTAALAGATLVFLFGVVATLFPSYGALAAGVALGIVGLAFCVAGLRRGRLNPVA